MDMFDVDVRFRLGTNTAFTGQGNRTRFEHAATLHGEWHAQPPSVLWDEGVVRLALEGADADRVCGSAKNMIDRWAAEAELSLDVLGCQASKPES